MKDTIKYVRFEDDKLIIIPTATGVELIEKLKPTVLCANDNGMRLPLTKSEESVGETKVMAYVANLPKPIKYLEVKISNVTNKYNVRAFVTDSRNYYFSIKKAV